MLELIDRQAAIRCIKEHFCDECNQYNELNCIDSLLFLPTIEAEPVKRGRWIPTEYDGYADENPVYDAFECSECGHEHNGEEDTLTAFCPDCGARMDGGAENVEKNCENCARETCAVMPPIGKCYCDFWQAMPEPPESEVQDDDEC